MPRVTTTTATTTTTSTRIKQRGDHSTIKLCHPNLVHIKELMLTVW